MLLNNYVQISGIELDLSCGDVSYDEVRSYNLWYTVEGIGNLKDLDTLIFDYYNLSVVKVKVGDRVLFRWHAIDFAYRHGSADGTYYVPYNDIVLIERQGEYIPVNGISLVEAEGQGNVDIGVVLSSANDVDHYVDYYGKVVKPQPIQSGMYAICRRFAGMEIEHKYYQTLDKKLFAFHDKDIILLTDEKFNVQER